MNISLVIITPTLHREEADAALKRLGWGDNNFLVELGPEKTGSPTDFGLRATVSPEFNEALQAEFAALEGAVLIDAIADDGRVQHFDTVLNTRGLHRIEPPYVD